MVTTVHTMYASVKFCCPSCWHVALEHDSVAITRCLIILVYIYQLCLAHFVSGEEIYILLNIARIISIVPRIDKLVVNLGHPDCINLYIISKFAESCF